MTPSKLIAKWREPELRERSATHSHFNGLSRVLGEPTPTDAAINQFRNYALALEKRRC